MIAIDLSGDDPKVKATTTASHPQATSAIAPAIRRNGRSQFRRDASVVIEVLDAHASGFQVAVDIHQTLDPSLQADAAEAGFGIKLQ